MAAIRSQREAADEALRLAEGVPTAAIAMAAEIVRSATDPVVRAVAQRAWGLALRHCGRLGSAIAHLRAAVRCAEDAGAVEVAGEARLTLAYALAERGWSAAALRELDLAFLSMESKQAQARVLAQRGGILLDLGHHDEALRCCREAIPVLQAAGDGLWAYRALWNRGLAHAYRHQFAAAEADLRRVQVLAEEMELPLAVGFGQANLAFVLGLRGQVGAALAESAAAETRIRAHDAQVGELLKDRSELLLSARLVVEARETAEQAVHEFEQEQRGMKLPQVRLVLAQAALLDGDAPTALTHARRAAREFDQQHRPEWAAAARLLALRAQRAAGRRSTADVRVGVAIAETLTAAHWMADAVEARIATAQILRAGGRPEQAAEHLELAAAARRRGPSMLRARGWYAEALVRHDEGRSQAAVRAVRAGLRVIDQHSVALGASDLRAAAAGHRAELAELGLRIAVASRSPRRVLEWAERSRATALMLQRPARPPDDTGTAQALAELRATVLRIAERLAAGDRRPAVDAHRRQRDLLERRIRDATRHRPGPSGGALPATVDADELAAALGDAALLELVVFDGEVIGVTVAGGTVRLRSLGPAAHVEGQVDRIGFAMGRLLRAGQPAASRTAARDLLRGSVARIDELLAATPELAGRPLVVVPTGSLQNVPWAALPSSAGRPIAVAPSAALWLAAHDRARTRDGEVVVAAGPSLPGAVAEARAVAALHGVEPLLPPDATVASVLRAGEGAALLHVAAHGRLAAHNALFSAVELVDGPMFAHDIERLDRAPHTVVLAACESGRSVVAAGDELLGLGSALLGAGSTQLVASMSPVPDLETRPLMESFHRFVARGRPVAEALALAQEGVRGDDSQDVAAMSFVCLGAGLRPVPRPARQPSLAAGAR